jgi:hypothetical protein
MTRARVVQAFIRVALVVVLIIALAAVFRAYQTPTHVVQWLMLLSLCR